MGNCFHRCFGIVDRRERNPRSKYTDEQDFSIENYYMDDGFDSLIDGAPQENEMTRLLTDRERQLLSTKQFGVLVLEQGSIDAELAAKLAQQEKEIEREEATFYEAKREASRATRLINIDKENTSKNNSKAWVDSDEWEIAGDEDEFENFLANVKARSAATRSQVINETAAQMNVSSQGSVDGSSKLESCDQDWDQDFVSAEDIERI